MTHHADPTSPATDRGPRALLTRLGRSRANRRWVVVAAYGGFLLMAVLFWLRSAFDLPGWFAALAFLPGLAHFVGFAALCSRALGAWRLANDPDDALDERELALRDRTYRLAYMGVSLLLILLMVAFMTVDTDRLTSPGALQAITWGTIVLTVTLPAAIVAWTEPDAPADVPEVDRPAGLPNGRPDRPAALA